MAHITLAGRVHRPGQSTGESILAVLGERRKLALVTGDLCEDNFQGRVRGLCQAPALRLEGHRRGLGEA
eukprot:CAMPEP_0204512602 /NCGR_PEP_ID=MMETSP0661-20131031/1043_1 /ASSEMBLY_ACC=CAM_ASM_000606 /TAXON_ID=109239 /ORGANISM="Alexandrium margalefi, Strain AMGDE01CS-322" /LENGTH=68 /DNA_ID=CAMNT_0051517727 /DNA_START=66 /DNA_END=268 /DNA_ORIENTATION=+